MEEVIRATELGIRLRGLVLPGGLRMASGEVLFDNPLIAVKPFQIPEGTVCHTVLTFLEEDVQAFLEAKRPGGLSGFRVSAKEGELTIVGIARALVPIEVGAIGTLEFSDGRLNFVPRRLEAAGINAEAFAKPVLSKVNPLVDLSGLPLHAEVSSIDIASGRIVLNARVETTAAIPRLEP
ncbi:MAG: DUF2993 domain-containing protein [Armatimonadetes bacterium]|nr:MAG: DUF2993 domain-containing protein [Armatimonadota bacterium]